MSYFYHRSLLFIAFLYHKPIALPKKIPAKNGVVKAYAKKGKPTSSFSESPENDSFDEDEVHAKQSQKVAAEKQTKVTPLPKNKENS